MVDAYQGKGTNDTAVREHLRGVPVGPSTPDPPWATWAAAARESVAAQGDAAPYDPGALGRPLWSPLYLPAGPEARGGHRGARPHPGGAAPPPGDLSAPGRDRRRLRGPRGAGRVCGR